MQIKKAVRTSFIWSARLGGGGNEYRVAGSGLSAAPRFIHAAGKWTFRAAWRRRKRVLKSRRGVRTDGCKVQNSREGLPRGLAEEETRLLQDHPANFRTVARPVVFKKGPVVPRATGRRDAM